MRILITSIVDLKKSQHNRPHHFVEHLCRKHDVSVLSINEWWKRGRVDADEFSCGFESSVGRVNYAYVSDKRRSPIVQELSAHKSRGQLLQENFDVQLNYNSPVLGYRLSREIPTVMDLADDIAAMIRYSPQIPKSLRPFAGYIGHFYLKRGVKTAQRVTVTVDALKDIYGIPDGKAEVLPNGVDSTLFQNRRNAKEDLGFSEFIIGYVGVLREWVDLRPVFRALIELDKDVRLLVVGGEGMLEGDKALARKYGVADRVTFVGEVPYAEVPKYMSAMDVCIIPFKSCAISQSALPLKLFEYMACEKPVISIELQGVRGAVDDRVLFTSDVAGYVTNIEMLQEDEQLRARLGREGRSFVVQNYGWEGITLRLERILAAVAA